MKTHSIAKHCDPDHRISCDASYAYITRVTRHNDDVGDHAICNMQYAIYKQAKRIVEVSPSDLEFAAGEESFRSHTSRATS